MKPVHEIHINQTKLLLILTWNVLWILGFLLHLVYIQRKYNKLLLTNSKLYLWLFIWTLVTLPFLTTVIFNFIILGKLIWYNLYWFTIILVIHIYILRQYYLYSLNVEGCKDNISELQLNWVEYKCFLWNCAVFISFILISWVSTWYLLSALNILI